MKRFHRILLSVLSGILLSMPWLGLPGWILFVAFLPLFYLENYFIKYKESYVGISFWGHAFLSVLIWNGLTTWWIAYATFIGASMAIVINSFLMSLVLWLGHFARRRFKSSLGFIAIIVFWISFEYFHFNWDIQWPWLTLGNGFANNIKIVQWYEFTGVFGGTLWILLTNFLILFLLINFRKYSVRQLLISASIVSFIIFFPAIYSFKKYKNYKEKNNPKSIVLVQPNIDPYNEDYSLEAENGKLKKFMQLAGEKANAQTDFIVGPETIVENYNNWNVDKFGSNSQYTYLNNFKNEYPKAELVFGVSSVKYYNSDEAPSTVRERDGNYYDVFNTAVFLQKNGDYQVYHKSILVSGVEKVPYLKYLGFLRNIFFNLGGTTGNLGSQKESSVFTTVDSINIAPVICYESVFGNYINSFVKKGAGLIFIITNDGWWRNSPGYQQHFSFARLRAIETRRSIARAANTGISGFINQRGDVVQKTSWWQPDAISEELNANDKITSYVRYGDYIARISFFVSILLILYLISSELQKDKKNPH